MPQFRDYHFHLPYYQVDGDRNLYLLYLIRVVSDLIGKGVFLFVPLFLYELGTQLSVFDAFNLNDLQKGLILFALYLLGGRAVAAVLSFPSARIINKHGTRASFMISFVGKLLQILGLKLAAFSIWWLGLAMVGVGISIVFFFNAYHMIFARNIGRKHVGEDLGLINFLIQIASIIAPMVSGAIIMVHGYDTVFLVGLILSMLGLGIAGLMETLTVKHKVSFKEFKAWVTHKQFGQKAISFAGRYFNDAGIALWPLYVYLILGGAEKVGFLYSLSLFIAMLLTFVTGFYIDHRKKLNRPFYLSGSVLSLIWLLRINVTSFWNIAIVDTIDKITSSVHWLLYDARYIGDGKGRNALAYFVYRELVISIFAVFLWAGVIGLFIFTGGWNALFALAAIGVLLSLLVKDHHLDQK